MNADEQNARIMAARRALYVRVQSAVVDWHAMREYAAAKTEALKNEMAVTDANKVTEIAKLQGAIAEMRYLAALEETIRGFLQSHPSPETTSETLG